MTIKILTIDDSKIIRQIVMKAFRPYDCTVLEAGNGVLGLATASREKPDLILLDYTMPIMDGFEVLARLRGDPDLKGTPVIMLTAEAGRETVVRIAKLGVRDYLIKPFKEELLLERVTRVVPLKLKSEAEEQPKRFDDPINVLVVDDKPAIIEQVRTGLANLSWKLLNASQPEEAMAICESQAVDVAIVSLSLPADAGFQLFQTLRGSTKTSKIPVFGLCVKTAAADQARAQQVGFAGVITKPINIEELKAKIARSLRLETTYKYFQEGNGWLKLTFPADFHPGVVNEVSPHLNRQLTSMVDAGGDRLIFDISAMEKATLPLIQFLISAIQSGQELSVRCVVIVSEAMKRECLNYEEAQSWLMAGNFEEAQAILGTKTEATAA